MRYCFKFGAIVVAAAAFATAEPAPKAKSVVRADRKTGRLVRTVVVPKKPDTAQQTGLEAVIDETARRYEVDPLLVHSVIQVESSYNPYALSPKGAQGLMQLIPSTARRFGVTNSFDVKQNIEGGVRYLKHLGNLFPNDLRLMLAAYNAGERAVYKYGTVPPYRETEDYVTRVGAKYRSASRTESKKAATQTTAAIVTPLLPAEPRYAPIETYVDADGKLYIRTKAPVQSVSP